MNRKLTLSLGLTFAMTMGVTIAQQADPATPPGDSKGSAGSRGPSMSGMIGGPKKFGDFAELTKDSTK